MKFYFCSSKRKHKYLLEDVNVESGVITVRALLYVSLKVCFNNIMWGVRCSSYA